MKRLFFTALSFVLPVITLAQTPIRSPLYRPPAGGSSGGIEGVITVIQRILNLLLPVVVTLALLLFIWGLVIFIKNAGNEEGRKEGKRRMGWGIVAIFVIITIWGIVRLIAGTFNIQEGGTIDIPQFPS